jgi:hypothetical protein
MATVQGGISLPPPSGFVLSPLGGMETAQWSIDQREEGLVLSPPCGIATGTPIFLMHRVELKKRCQKLLNFCVL